MTPHPPRRQPHRDLSVLVGACELFPVVLVEASSALGILLGKRRCPNDRLEEVLYFRFIMGEAYTIFLDAVDLDVLDGYSIACDAETGALIHDPSLLPYEVTHLTREIHKLFVDRILNHDNQWVERSIASLFEKRPGFSVGPDHRLICPPDYGHGFEHFMGTHAFIDPKRAKRKK